MDQLCFAKGREQPSHEDLLEKAGDPRPAGNEFPGGLMKEEIPGSLGRLARFQG